MLLLSHIFYSFGLLFFINNFKILMKFNRYYYLKEWYIKFQKVTGERPKSQEFRTKEDYNNFMTKNILSFFEIMWISIGIFTNNWFLFLFILIITISTSNMKISLTDRILSFCYFSIKSLVYLLLFVNEFHLRMNLLDVICSLF
jgi:hypothetical protein